MCQAFEIQVKSKDATRMHHLLQRAFQKTKAESIVVTFMPYRCRHDLGHVFHGAVVSQQEIQDSYRVVTVKGIHPDHHFAYEASLRESFQQAIQVLETNATTHANYHDQPVGKYNILCKKQTFITLARQLDSTLATHYYQFLEAQGISPHPGAEEVKVLSRFPKDGEALGEVSDQSVNSRETFYSTLSIHFPEFSPVDGEEATQNNQAPSNGPAPIPTTTSHNHYPSEAQPNRSYASVARARTSSDHTAVPPAQPQIFDPYGYARESISDPKIKEMFERMTAMDRRMAQMDTLLQQLVTNSSAPPPSPSDLTPESAMNARFDRLEATFQQVLLLHRPESHSPNSAPFSQDIATQELFTSPPRKRSHRNPSTPSPRQDGAFIGNDEGSHDEAMNHESS
jgi:hypothetical protein